MPWGSKEWREKTFGIQPPSPVEPTEIPSQVGPRLDFSGDINRGWNPSANWLDQTDDRLTSWMTTLPQQSMAGWGQFAQQGVFGDGGLDYIMRGSGQEQSLKRKRMQDYMRRRYARRLGPRAGGAAETGFANRVLAPGFAEDAATRRGYRAENLRSRMSALSQRDQVMQMLAQMWSQKVGGAGKEDEGGGFLDWIKAAAQVAQFVPGPQQPGVAAGNQAVQRIPD